MPAQPIFNEFTLSGALKQSTAQPPLAIPPEFQLLPPFGMTKDEADSLANPDTLPDHILDLLANVLTSVLSHDTLCIFNDTA